MNTISERFWAKVDRRGNDDCWPWLAADNGHGYGVMMTIKPRLKLATHLSLEFAGQPRPEGAWALHSCDNAICVNPAHLRWADVTANNREMHERGRWHRRPMKGEANTTAKLKEADILEIRASTETQAALARRFGVTQAMISRIKRRIAWRHI